MKKAILAFTILAALTSSINVMVLAGLPYTLLCRKEPTIILSLIHPSCDRSLDGTGSSF